MHQGRDILDTHETAAIDLEVMLVITGGSNNRGNAGGKGSRGGSSESLEASTEVDALRDCARALHSEQSTL